MQAVVLTLNLIVQVGGAPVDAQPQYWRLERQSMGGVGTVILCSCGQQTKTLKQEFTLRWGASGAQLAGKLQEAGKPLDGY